MRVKKILITGGTGFVGSNFVYKFLKSNAEVHLIARPKSDFWRLDPIKKNLFIHYVNLKNEEAVKKTVFKIKPEVVMNFAAYGLDQGKPQDIQKAIDINLLATINLLNACSRINLRCFINTGSSSEYGIKNHPIKENDILEPTNFYGVTKSAGTIYCQFLAKKFDLPAVTLRLFSPYGYFEDRKRLIPALILASLRDSQIDLVSPKAVRDFIFIEDVISAYLKVIEKIDFVKGDILNVASGKQHSISDIVRIIEKITGGKINKNYNLKLLKQYEPKTWVADISKIKKLNWNPAFSLEEGLKKTIKWFKKNQNLYL